jgi:nitrogen fixation protein NifU and related proteins
MLSPLLLLLYQSQAHAGEVERATHRGTAGEPGCGPYLVITLRVEKGIVREARFRTYGCPVMMACAELVCLRIEGERLEAARAATAEEVLRWGGGVPEGKEHCIELAAKALRSIGERQTADVS